MVLKIVLVGKPNSGQRETAVHLKRKHGFKRLKLMDGVIRLCRFLYNYKRYERTPWVKQRDIYDALYTIDPNIWTTYLFHRLSTTTSSVIVEDVKFINELEQLQKAGFITVRLISSDEKKRADSIGRYFGQKIIPGSVVMSEYFNRDISRGIKVDYNIHYTTRESLYRTLDDLIASLLTK